jgi:16S rRNA (cytosine967-C5)-methyltransferase
MAELKARVFRQILCEWIARKVPVDRVVNESFREHRLGPSERAAVGDRVYSWVRHWAESGMELWTSIPQKPRDLKAFNDQIQFLWEHPWSEELHERLEPSFRSDPQGHLKRFHNWKPELWPGSGDPSFLTALHDYLHASWSPAPLTLRWLAEPVDSAQVLEHFPGARLSRFVPGAVHLDSRMKLNRDSGLFEIQDESSQMISRIVNPQPGEKILDLCAGAGGKTLHLANLMKGRGELWAFDRDTRKLQELMLRARRLGLTNIRCLSQAPTQRDFDVVLVDAPCSSLGVLRRTPDRWMAFGEDHLRGLRHAQSELAEQALSLTLPSGRAFFATCSFRLDEAEPLSGLSPKELDWSWVDPSLRATFLTELRQSPAARIAASWPGRGAPNAFVWSWSNRQGSGSFEGDGFSLCRLH